MKRLYCDAFQTSATRTRIFSFSRPSLKIISVNVRHFVAKKVDFSKDYYFVLNIPINATKKEVKRSFANLAKKYHPDVNVNKTQQERSEAAKRFEEILDAYEILKDDKLRTDYDVVRKPKEKKRNNMRFVRPEWLFHQDAMEFQMEALERAKREMEWAEIYKTESKNRKRCETQAADWEELDEIDRRAFRQVLPDLGACRDHPNTAAGPNSNHGPAQAMRNLWNGTEMQHTSYNPKKNLLSERTDLNTPFPSS